MLKVYIMNDSLRNKTFLDLLRNTQKKKTPCHKKDNKGNKKLTDLSAYFQIFQRYFKD